MFRLIIEFKDPAPHWIISPAGDVLCKCHYLEYAEFIMAALKQCEASKYELPTIKRSKYGY